MKISAFLVFSFLLSASSAHAISEGQPSPSETAVAQLVLIKYDLFSERAAGRSRDGMGSRKIFADLLHVLREAGVKSVFLDYNYPKRPLAAEESLLLGNEFAKYNQENTPMLQICAPTRVPEAVSEPFIKDARWGTCYTYDTGITDRGYSRGAVATYCSPIGHKDGKARGGEFMPADSKASKLCRAEDRSPAINALEHAGFSVDPARMAKTQVIGRSGPMGKGLDIAFLEHAPTEFSVIDVVSGKIDPAELKNKIVFVGTTIPGRDETAHAGKTQHGIYAYIFEYLAIVSDEYRALARDRVFMYESDERAATQAPSIKREED